MNIQHSVYRLCLIYFMMLWLPVTKAAVSHTLSVDLASVPKPISPYLYCVNIANWSQTYYLDLVTPRLQDARVTAVRLGATNMERYNFQTNRMYNVITKQNQYVPLSWRSFLDWSKEKLKADAFLQIPVYGHVAGDGNNLSDINYNHEQSLDEVAEWVQQTGNRVKFWGIGNEPFIAWKRSDFPGIYQDSAHGDQVLNSDTAYDHYFSRFAAIAHQIKRANPAAKVLGPTPANWWLYWNNDFSPFCPVKTKGGDALPDDPGWSVMDEIGNQWNPEIFPDRGGNPDVVGWEEDPQRNLVQYAIRMQEDENKQGIRIADFIDVHRYINPITDQDALKELRGLWDGSFPSYGDRETQSLGIHTNLLNRLQNIVDTHYPGTALSLSEYDYFYWLGHPSEPQIAALGLMDFLGSFARNGVELACNWYVGEENQSGSGYHHASDSAKQAMFDEQGQPNPKYWTFWLMSRYFRGNVLAAESSDWDKFSIYAAKSANKLRILVSYKGQYDGHTGRLSSPTSAASAFIQFKGLSARTIAAFKPTQVLRFANKDPFPVSLNPKTIKWSGNGFRHVFTPLSIYLFEFERNGKPVKPAASVFFTPESINFGAYETGVSFDENDGKYYTVPVSITNADLNGTRWVASKTAPWLSIVGRKAGTSLITDKLYLTVDRSKLAVGEYQTHLMIKTAKQITRIPVRMEVVPGESNGEKRLSDFDTGSLAHAWSDKPPYSLGWWDGHGNPGDRDSPYIYNLSLDSSDKPALGGIASLQIQFNRRNGDDDNNKRYASFGTYGDMGDWSQYGMLSFDIKTSTVAQAQTRLLLTLMDANGQVAKPAINIDHFYDTMTLADDRWHTLTIPLDGVFYDWRYPEGQNGHTVQLDWAHITQMQFTPWPGDNDKDGVIHVDNVTLHKRR